MSKLGKRSMMDNDQMLEGGGAGAGISGTKWSKMPSFKGNASTMGDLKKLTKDTSHLKGSAKAAADEAKARAATRTGVRALGPAAVVEGMRAASGDSEAKSKPTRDTDEDNFQETKRIMREVDADIKAEKYAKPDGSDEYKRGGKVSSSASRRGDGIAMKGKTKGRFV
jgi:hypothetical protein